MLAKLIQFVKTHQADIVLVIGVILISLLSFAVGYIVAKTYDYDKESIQFKEGGYYWGRNYRTLFGLETFGEGT